MARVVDLSIPCPSPDVQGAIANRLDKATADSDRMTKALEHQIDLLVERRQALITASVTGHLDIPGVAA